MRFNVGGKVRPLYLLEYFVGIVAAFSAAGAHAYTERTAYAFCEKAKCGFGPEGSLLFDEQGHIFGVTVQGGANNMGTVYELSQTKGKWKSRTIFDFSTPTGSETGGLIRDTEGNLYGIADRVVYELVSNADRTEWQEKTLYTFGDDYNGQGPHGALTYFGAATGAPYDGVSPLYGLTTLGGYNEHGVAFALTPQKDAWIYTVIYRFCVENNCADGAYPANIQVPSPKKILGSTTVGGVSCTDGCGTIFELDSAITVANKGPWRHTTLHTFCAQGGSCTDGIWPSGSLVIDSAGNLFGTTVYGGSANKGTLFEVVPNGTNSSESILYNFCGLDNCLDGSVPQGGLTLGPDGTLFGTTLQGAGFHGDGGVFSFAGSQLTVLYGFCPGDQCVDGRYPTSPVVLDDQGNIFGAVDAGQDSTGVIFELSP